MFEKAASLEGSRCPSMTVTFVSGMSYTYYSKHHWVHSDNTTAYSIQDAGVISHFPIVLTLSPHRHYSSPQLPHQRPPCRIQGEQVITSNRCIFKKTVDRSLYFTLYTPPLIPRHAAVFTRRMVKFGGHASTTCN